MTDQPMSEERLEEIERNKITWPYVPDLVKEVRRLRGKDQDLDVLRMAYDEKVRLLENVAPQLLLDPDLWDTMRSERDEALASAAESEHALSSELRYTEELEAKLEKLDAYASGLCDYKDAWADQKRRAEKAKAKVDRLRSVLFAIGKMSAGGLREWALKEARSDD